MSDVTQLVFLHGLGETPAAWDEVITQLPPSFSCRAYAVFSDADFAHGWHLDSVTDRIAQEISEPAHIVGLSLGAVIGLNLAIRHPHVVKSLFLSAPQAKPSPMLMRIQSVLMRVLPTRLVCPPGVAKPQLLQVLDSVSSIDFVADLAHITVDTTVVCGSKDKANQSAAISIARSIPNATHHTINGAGHRWHTSMPEEFAHTLTTHLSRL